jgi:uncharacterized protein (TIGR03067 family)
MSGLLLLIAAAAVSAADSDDAVKKERKALAGGWAVDVAERDGERILDAEAHKIRLYFGDERVTLKQGEKGKELLYGLGLEGNPRTIELKATDGPYKNQPLHGIYELNGNILKICFPFDPQAARPAEYSAPAGSGRMLLVLKRDKP